MCWFVHSIAEIMLHTIKVNVLFVVGVSMLYIFIATSDCNAKPLDIYDEIIGNDEKQLLLHMAEFIDSIGADESGRFATNNRASNPSSTINELKDMKPGERCILPVRKGVCRALIPRWSYDPIARECREFKFGGCDGNGNNFSTRKQCMEVCKGV